jgi:hypothetical protein
VNRHLARVLFWAAQIPPAVWAAFQHGLRPYLFAYLVVISLMALVESALTDYFAAKRAG